MQKEQRAGMQDRGLIYMDKDNPGMFCYFKVLKRARNALKKFVRHEFKFLIIFVVFPRDFLLKCNLSPNNSVITAVTMFVPVLKYRL